MIGLSKWDEEEIVKQVRLSALEKCDNVVRQYAECVKNSWLVWKCKPVANLLNECVHQ
jgi:hypothetical protein